MTEQLLLQLEHAAHILLAPPNIVSCHQRQAAESVFINYKKTKNPYAICKQILEKSQDDYVLFQSVSTIREAIMVDWSVSKSDDVKGLRSFLLEYALHRPALQNYVLKQILQSVAVIYKRGTVEGNLEDRETLLNDVSQLLGSENTHLQTVACGILLAMLVEYGSSCNASNMGLTLELHSHCKRAFETHDLKHIFVMCVQRLQQLVTVGQQLTVSDIPFLTTILNITEQVLSWSFTPIHLPKKFFFLFDTDSSPSLRVDSSWRDTLLDKNLIEFFFKVHECVRIHTQLSHHSLQALTQLASLNGPIFSGEEAKVDYLQFFIQSFLHLLSSIELQPYETLGIAGMVNKMLIIFPMSSFMNIPQELLESFLNQLAKLTCNFCQQINQEHEDDHFSSEAFNQLLEAWITFLKESRSFPEGYFRNASIEIFNCYLYSHLSGRNVRSKQDSDKLYDINELEEDDRERFKDELSIIGAFSRQALDHTVPLLSRLLEERLQQLCKLIQTNSPSTFEELQEDLHWLLLITGYVLADEMGSELGLIPSEVIQFSLKQANQINIKKTLAHLVSPWQFLSSLDDTIDQVIRVISTGFFLCEIERQACEKCSLHHLSPQVAVSLMWFIRRWSLVYLLHDETYYTEISLVFSQAFGSDTECSKWIIEYLLGKIIVNLKMWCAESCVINDTVNLLLSLVDKKHRGQEIAKCKVFWSLCQEDFIHRPPLSKLPSSARKSLIKALVLGASATSSSEADMKEQYIKEVLWPLLQDFEMRFTLPDFNKVCFGANFIRDILGLLELFMGVAGGVRVYNVNTFAPFLHLVIEKSIQVLGVYHNYNEIVQQVMELFVEITRCSLCYLNESDSKKMYRGCLKMIETFTKYNAGKRSHEVNAEEEQYMDILLLMELLTNLLAKDFIDFGTQGNVSPEEVVCPVDVALYGLNTVMPLMNAELLKFPRLCLQYFKLITFMCEIYPEKISHLPHNVYENLLASIQLGLSGFGSEITSLSLDFLAVLGTQIYEGQMLDSSANSTLQPFLKIVLDLVLLQNFDQELISTASNTLFTLICCHKDKYRELIQDLINNQINSTYQQRLAEAFNNLTPSELLLHPTRQSKVKFKFNLEKLILEIKGIVCVK